MGFAVEKFIKTVEKYPFFYAPTHEDYKNLTRRCATWDLIGKEFNESGDKLRKRWRNLRDSYLKYRRSLENPKIKNGSAYKSWPWSHLMTFLDEHLTPKDPSNHSDAQITETEFDAACGRNDAIEIDEPYVCSNSDRLYQQTSAIYEDYNKDPLGSQNDAIDHMFASYAQTFRGFNKRRQVALKLELAKMFANAEIEDLEERESKIAKLDVQEACGPSTSWQVKTEYGAD